MVKVFSQKNDGFTPRIDRKAVSTFFRQRAEKARDLGFIQAVIYQDNNPELALRRDEAEKIKLLPLLNLRGKESVLDVGCGTGRWADVVIPRCKRYVGTDFSQELIGIAQKRLASQSNATFICIPAEEVSPDVVPAPFDIIISLGLLIYLNDDELLRSLRGYASVANNRCKILFREPVGVNSRLTIKEHFSEDMNQIYNAIYRTEEELKDAFDTELVSHGFKLIGSGDVYDASLNNRAETKQKWFLLEREK